jgi:sulfite reductase (NADPH) flavoprotein alpha-component
VDEILALTHLVGDTEVAHDGPTRPLRAWLAAHRELTRLARPVVAAIAERTGDAHLFERLAGDDFAAWLRTRQVADLLGRGTWTATQLVATLRPLAPRLYSIASSRAVVGDEVHLTVARTGDAARPGAASHFLASLDEGQRARVFVERNERFRPPADTDRDVVMIGPGTGVAPFRGFVQHRAAQGARGRNWLVFGNPHFRHDFLYQVEWQQALRDGILHKLDLAFSRDQADKVYVQQRLRENGRELFAWLDNGAHLYVCGDATRMARDVHAALADIVAMHGGRDGDEYLSQLQQQGRYARDVY